jgi:hypothetical protein
VDSLTGMGSMIVVRSSPVSPSLTLASLTMAPSSTVVCCRDARGMPGGCLLA